jgi:hypothetical protein
MRITAKRLGPFIIACKEDSKSYYIERYDDGQFGFRLNKKDATLFQANEIDRALRRLRFDCPDVDEFTVQDAPFRIVAVA